MELFVKILIALNYFCKKLHLRYLTGFSIHLYSLQYIFTNLSYKTFFKVQKQPPRGVLMKKCSENMQQMYKRTLTPKCDFNEVAKQLY